MRVRSLIVSGMAACLVVLGGGGPASAGGGGCMSGTAPTDSGGTVVEMVGLCFTPTVLHVEPGTEVTFVNRDTTNHMVTGIGGTWGTYDELRNEERVAYSFDEDGVYVYTCVLHPGMAGAIVAGSGTGDAGMEPTSVAGGLVAEAGAATPPATPESATDGNALGALLAGGTLGLVVGGGLAAAAMRRRREAALERAVV
jgi:plastocyanin